MTAIAAGRDFASSLTRLAIALTVPQNALVT
jgi:hypothetical protein